MASVNIDGSFFLIDTCTHQLQRIQTTHHDSSDVLLSLSHRTPVIRGTLKFLPGDFVVDEIKIHDPTPEAPTLSRKTEVQSARVGNDSHTPIIEQNLFEQLTILNGWWECFEEHFIDTIQTNNKVEWSILSAMNLVRAKFDGTLILSENCGFSIVKELPISKPSRKQFYDSIKLQFPFLRIEVEKCITSDSEGSTLSKISVYPDLVFLNLLNHSLPIKDVQSLYIFRSEGPIALDTDGKGHTGILIIGSELPAAERCYSSSYIRSNCSHFDCRTMDDENSNSSDKCIHVKWNHKAMKWLHRQTGGFLGESKCGTETQQSDLVYDTDVHIGFLLRKVNMEHLRALTTMSAILDVPLSSISYSGIKDRRAVTSQNCCLTIPGQSQIGVDESLPQFRARLNRVVSLLSSMSSPVRNGNIQSSIARKRRRIDEIVDDDLSDDSYIQVESIAPRNARIWIGQHLGNRFDIRLRKCSYQQRGDSVLVSNIASFDSFSKDIMERIQFIKTHGFPNYFGSQRMQRMDDDASLPHLMPVGCLVGKYLALGDYCAAVDAIILGNDGIASTRFSAQSMLFLSRSLYSNGDLLRAIQALPAFANRERTIIKSLLRSKSTAASLSEGAIENIRMCPIACHRALNDLPFAMRQLWIHSYQSWLWNRVACYRLKAAGPMLAVGDLGFRSSKSSISVPPPFNPEDATISHVDFDSSQLHVDSKIITLSEHDINDKSNNVTIMLPLIGSRIKFPSNDTGRYYKQLLVDEGLLRNLDDESLDVKQPDNSRSLKGAYRPILQTFLEEPTFEVIIPTSNAAVVDEEIANCHDKGASEASIDLKLTFALPPGSYATSFLRELLQNNDVI